jgi:capsular exopolysaccharide synthesis family protein
MGSMARVMQRIEEDHSGPELAEPGDAAVARSAFAGSESPETEARSAFIATEPEPTPGERTSTSRSAAESGASNDQTATWDAQRVDPVVVAFHDPYSAICEQYRSVRARLLTMNPTHSRQVLAITSAIPEEGKSVSTLNLGLIMAEGGEHRILVVDADFRRTSLARMLGVSAQPGLADVLRGDMRLADALRPSPVPNLHVLTAGQTTGGAYAELLSGQCVANLVDELRNTFAYTFVDTPPVTTVSDVCLLAPHCDGAILIVQMGRTPEPTVQQAVRMLQANNVKTIGTILSHVRERGSGYYEHYYSYYHR